MSEYKVNCIIGIDPGASGGIAVFVPGYKVKTVEMPKDMVDLRDFLAYFGDNFKPVIFLEKLSVRPDDIVQGEGKAAMGKLYRIQKMIANYEHLKAVIETLGIPYVLIHPRSWQSKLGLAKTGEEKAERKRRLKAAAEKLYPGAKVTLWNSDALLIMHFGRWALKNDVKWIKANLPQREHSKLFENV